MICDYAVHIGLDCIDFQGESLEGTKSSVNQKQYLQLENKRGTGS